MASIAEQIEKDCEPVLRAIKKLHEDGVESVSTQAVAFRLWNLGYKRVTDALSRCKELGLICYDKGWLFVDQSQVDTVQEGEL